MRNAEPFENHYTSVIMSPVFLGEILAILSNHFLFLFIDSQSPKLDFFSDPISGCKRICFA